MVAHAHVALRRGEHTWQERQVSGRAERVHARSGEGEVHAAVELVVRALGLVPRTGPTIRRGGVAGDGVRQRASVGPGSTRHRLDHHHAHVALGTGGEEFLGGLAVLGARP